MSAVGLLDDKVAIVTGAGSGIGAGIAQVLRRVGARLVLTDLDPWRIDADGATALEHDVTSVFPSKFAVIGLTQGLAEELTRYDVRVNAVCPGVVNTPLSEPLLDQLSATKGITRDEAWLEFVDGIPLGRPQEPQDIGETVAFLASDHARNMTGQGLNVTGGMQVHR